MRALQPWTSIPLKVRGTRGRTLRGTTGLQLSRLAWGKVKGD